MKIKDLKRMGAESLSERSSAILDSEILLANVIGQSREYLLAHDEEEVANGPETLFWQYVDRVKKGEPIAYITGEKEFFGFNFYVDKRVLVPRPETELLVEQALDYMREYDDGRRFKVIDVGTGSGNIAVAIAKSCDEGFDVLESVEAVDISEDALDVAVLNVEQHGVEDKVHVLQSDLLEIVDEGEHYDIILANLPYIGEITNDFLGEGVKEFEPASALFAGTDGLDLYKKMFQQIVDKKVIFKLFIGEFTDTQTRDLEPVLNNYFDRNWRIVKDLQGNDRIFVINGENA